MEKNGTPASPATARASRVLPVPGCPVSRTPRGMRAHQPVDREQSEKGADLAAADPRPIARRTVLRAGVCGGRIHRDLLVVGSGGSLVWGAANALPAAARRLPRALQSHLPA
jgi:hypothetical protein